MSFERLRELLALGLDKHNKDQELEFIQLISQRRYDQKELIPHPTCCEAIQEYPILTFVALIGEDGNPTDGRWRVRVDSSFWDDYNGGHYIDYIRGMPAPEYCPFCATKLPVMTLKKPLPPNLSRVSDGGYYCDNCKERLDGCICDPPSSAFEPCIEEPLKTIPMASPLFSEDKNES